MAPAPVLAAAGSICSTQPYAQLSQLRGFAPAVTISVPKTTSTPVSSSKVLVTPSVTPSLPPSVTPSIIPSIQPSVKPSVTPSVTPSTTPSITPSVTPSDTPSDTPSVTSSVAPSVDPSVEPSITPSDTRSITPSVTLSITPSSTSTSTVPPQACKTPAPPTCCDSVAYTANGRKGTYSVYYFGRGYDENQNNLGNPDNNSRTFKIGYLYTMDPSTDDTCSFISQCA
ncbi:hypothetical protein ACLMJK_003805 [Lecanora helva]